jgi:hypothetical protein
MYLSGKLLLTLASTFILDSESRSTHDHILLPRGPGNRATHSMYLCTQPMCVLPTYIRVCVIILFI